VTPSAPQGYTPAGYRQDDPLVLSGMFGDERRDGAWLVPPYLKIKGGVTLDFQRAQWASEIISIDVDAKFGEILLIVPVGWRVDHDRFTTSMGSSTVKIDPSQLRSGKGPLLIITGSILLGSLTIRHPSWWDRRRARRQLKQEAKNGLISPQPPSIEQQR
jgi:hypothetical protein